MANALNEQAMMKSASTIFGRTAKLAGIVVGVSGLAFLAGWQKSNMYYETMGIGWVSPLLSSAQITVEAQFILPPVLLAILVSLTWLFKARPTTLTISRVSLIAMTLGLLMLGAGVISLQFLPPSLAFLIVSLGAVVLAAFAGIKTVELIGSYDDLGMNWASNHLWIIYSVFVFGFFSTPAALGWIQAKEDLNPEYTRLPRIEIVEDKGEEHWRLVGHISGQILAANLKPSGGEPSYRFIQPQEIKTITSRPPHRFPWSERVN